MPNLALLHAGASHLVKFCARLLSDCLACIFFGHYIHCFCLFQFHVLINCLVVYLAGNASAFVSTYLHVVIILHLNDVWQHHGLYI